MDRFNCRTNLRDVAPENLFWDSVRDPVTKSIGACEMVLYESLGEREVIGDKYEGAVSKCSGCEGVND